jgi:hypothetical protein
MVSDRLINATGDISNYGVGSANFNIVGPDPTSSEPSGPV